MSSNSGSGRPWLGASPRVTLAIDAQADLLVALDQAPSRLERLEPRLCRVVECRYFSGLTDAETALVLQVTPRTVQRDWTRARAWLYRELHG